MIKELKYAWRISKHLKNNPELEIRMGNLPALAFDTIKHFWPHSFGAEQNIETTYCSATDDRRNRNGEWQQKVLITRQPTRVGSFYSSVCVALEQPCNEPEDAANQFTVVQRCVRVSSVHDDWRLDISKYNNRSVAELEYIGSFENSRDAPLTNGFAQYQCLLQILVPFSIHPTHAQVSPYFAPYITGSRQIEAFGGQGVFTYARMCAAKCQPVSLSRARLARLNPNDYMACAKTDGIRAVLYVQSTRHGLAVANILFVRKNQGRIIVPCTKSQLSTQQAYMYDGELVGKTLYVFDVWRHRNRNCLALPYMTRQRLMDDMYLPKLLGIEVKRKHAIAPARMEAISQNQSDGLILYHKRLPHCIYKFKDKHTVDAVVSADRQWQSSDGKKYGACPDSGYWPGDIVECDITTGAWVPIKIRTDKDCANYSNVINEITAAAKSRLTRADLYKWANKNK